VEKFEDEGASALGRRLSRQRAQAGDREAQKLVRTLHADIKVADKLLKKTGDVWKISQETDLVDLVIGARGAEANPRAYVLLKPREIKPLLLSIRAAAEGAGENEETLAALEQAARDVEGKPSDYLTFGFDPWQG
jgi:tRNA1(Val) A37 N6-methylase TrmN6